MIERRPGMLFVDGEKLDGARREEIALELTSEALGQARRALMGLLAIPSAVALGAAAWVNFGAAAIERALAAFESGFDRSRVARDAAAPPPRAEDPAEKTKQARS